MKGVLSLVLIALIHTQSHVKAQNLKTNLTLPDLNTIGIKCDSLRNSGQYKKAANLYFQTAQKLKSSELYVYAAWQYGLAKIPDSALTSINFAISNGMINPNVLSVYNLDDIGKGTKLRNQVNHRLDSIKQSISKIENFEIVIAPLDSFWPYFNAALSDKDHAAHYFTSYVINGSAAVKDYYHKHYENINNMVIQMIRKTPGHYLHTQAFFKEDGTKAAKTKMVQMMRNFAKMYPNAMFPKVYLVPGILNSNGTQLESGLYMGAEMFAKTEDMPTDGLTGWQKDNISTIDDMVWVTVHELMHFQQSYTDVKNNETLLGKVIREGVCDYLVELVSDTKALSKGRLTTIDYLNDPKNLKPILSEFERDMYAKNLSNWMYNGGRIKDRPSDLGYALGYKICKSYYEKSNDKKVALFELLNTNDFRKILLGSQYACLL